MLNSDSFKVSRKKNDKYFKVYEYIVRSKTISEYVDIELTEFYAPKVQMPGFRKGHTPLDALRARYGIDATPRAVRKIIEEIVASVISKEKFDIAMSPEIKLESELVFEDLLSGKSDLKFSVTYTLKPEIPEIKYDKISIDAMEVEISNDEKKKEIESFAMRITPPKEISDNDAAVASGDIVDIDFSGRVDGNLIEGGTAKNFKLEIGSKSFIDTFEDQIIGHKKGDQFTVNVNFPEQYHSEALSGKPAIFEVVLNSISRKELPTLDDEFAKKIGFDSITKVEDLILDNVKSEYNKWFIGSIKNEVLKKIVDKYDFDIPENLIEKDIESKLAKIKETTEKDGKKFDEKSERKALMPEILETYRIFFLIDKIASDAKIDLSDDKLMQAAFSSGYARKDIQEKFEKDPNFKHYLSLVVKENEAFNEHIYPKISKKVKKLSRKEFDEYIKSKSKVD